MARPIRPFQWRARTAHRKGREVRFGYYDWLLRTVIEMLEGALSLLEADGLTEERQGVTRALIELEDAWAALALKKTTSVMRGNEQGLRQPRGGREGGGDGERGPRPVRLLRHVLVIDDDEGIREVVAMAASAIGYEVVSVGDGAAALECLATVQPAVVLLDMRMPTMDGWAFAQAYERLPEPHAPVIVMTAARDAARRAAEINAAAYLAKPFNLVDLQACIDHWAN